jgi:hypothetical protein
MTDNTCAFGVLLATALATHAAQAFEPVRLGQLDLKPSFKTILALQYGEGINYGFGAIDSPGETERSVAYLVAKPKVDLSLPLAHQALVGDSSLYGALSVVAATTQLDGELSGQVARAGDWAVSTDHAYLGWKNEVLDLSVGGQEFSVGDGFIIGDGNYNKGGENGQYWSGGFLSWRNTAILKSTPSHCAPTCSGCAPTPTSRTRASPASTSRPPPPTLSAPWARCTSRSCRVAPSTTTA